MRSRGLTIKLRDESGSMLVELMVSMIFLAVAVGALMSLYASSVMAMRHTSIEGNALTLTDKQAEVYKTLPYASVMLDGSTIPGGSDPYATAHSTDATIPASTGEVTGGTIGAGACTAPTQAQPQCATQQWTGPDGRAYRVDSYIVSCPGGSACATLSTSGRAVKQVTIVVRRMTTGSASSQVWARATFAIDQANPPQ